MDHGSVYAQYRHQPGDLARNVTLNALHDRDEVLFYRLLTGRLSEMLPVVCPPTAGQAIEHYSHEYRRPRGIYLSVDRPELIEASLLASGLGPDEVDLIVAAGAGAILGNRGLGGRRHPHRGGQARRLHRRGRDRSCPHDPGHAGRGDRPAKLARRPAVYR